MTGNWHFEANFTSTQLAASAVLILAALVGGFLFLTRDVGADDEDPDEFRQYTPKQLATHQQQHDTLVEGMKKLSQEVYPSKDNGYARRSELLKEHEAELKNKAANSSAKQAYAAAWYQKNKDKIKAKRIARYHAAKVKANKQAVWTAEKRAAHAQKMKDVMNDPAVKERVSLATKEGWAKKKSSAVTPSYGAKALR